MAFIRKRSDHSADAGRSRKRRQSVDFDSADAQVLESEINSWVRGNRPKLGDVMLELGAIDPDQLLEALQQQKEDPAAASAQLGQVLLQMGSIDETALAAALAAQFDIPLADLRNELPDPVAAELVGEELARKHTVIPLRREDDRVFMAIADPLNTEAINELTRKCRRIGLMMGTRTEIERLLDQTYNALSDAQTHIAAFELTNDDGVTRAETDSFAVDENAPVVQVVNRIVTQGVRSRASDVHIEPGENFVRVRYRVDGAMTEAIRLPSNMSSALVSRLKVMAGLNIVERRRPQDGQFGVTVDGRPIDIRISTVATVHGEKTVMRLLDKTKSLISLKELGMHPAVEPDYLEIVKAPLGMLLCTGPTGSGKTTTLYATLAEINDPTRNVVTIEDPVEYQFDGVSQMPVSDTGMSFADGLRGILRQDPDVILVGEIRDEETARIAMQASLTGHFVLSSLHAVDSVAAVHRFTDMGLEPFLVASSLSGVVGQRLLRRTCPNCATPYTPTPAEVRILDQHVGHQPVQWLKGTGCSMCANTGYRGRVGVYELLNVTDTLREMIVAKASHHELRAVAVEEGMRTMQEQAFELVVQGKTTIEDVLRSVYAPGAADRDMGSVTLELPAGKRAIRRATDAIASADHAPGEAPVNVIPDSGQAFEAPAAPSSQSPIDPTPNGDQAGAAAPPAPATSPAAPTDSSGAGGAPFQPAESGVNS